MATVKPGASRASRTSRNEAVSMARLQGVLIAARECGVGTATLRRWCKEDGVEVSDAGPPSLLPTQYGVVEATSSVKVPDLARVKTQAVIAAEMVGEEIESANVYVAWRRAQLRTRVVDALHTVIDRLEESDSGKDAQSWAVAFGILTDKMRLEAGAPSDVKGLVQVRASMDEQQAREWAGRDLSTPMTAAAPADEPIDAEVVE